MAADPVDFPAGVVQEDVAQAAVVPADPAVADALDTVGPDPLKARAVTVDSKVETHPDNPSPPVGH